ncbi:NAD(P)-binding protein [Streptomyces sp. NBC_01478]|uniref:NAD(P)-binding protein n=1 Tax=Streptomyces sp. NBC_01478 TaxID=2903882 RepID=UPI002E358E27|nr:NAD(P)-binding protein [Streptomyces sp. NBC_01478]
MHRITVIGGGLAGLTAAIAAAEAGAEVTVYEAHHTLGGRARTAEGPYRTNDGPHALHSRGPHWTWLRRRGLLGTPAPVPVSAAGRFRLRHHGVLRRTPPLPMLRLLHRCVRQQAPVDVDFMTWATGVAGAEAARAAAHRAAGVLFHHDPGALSAAFVRERLLRAVRVPAEARRPRGGWATVVDRMAARAWQLGVRVETLSRVDTLPMDTPVVVATSLDAARRLLGDDSLTWTSGRTALLDLALRTRRGDPFAVSDLDSPGWVEWSSARDRSLAPAGEQLLQAQVPIAPYETKADGVARAEELLDLGFRGWRERVVWWRAGVASGRTGAVDLPGRSWRDRPGVDRGDGVYLAGDQVAAPGVLSEVSFNSALTAVSLALAAPGPASRTLVPARRTLDLKHT